MKVSGLINKVLINLFVKYMFIFEYGIETNSSLNKSAEEVANCIQNPNSYLMAVIKNSQTNEILDEEMFEKSKDVIEKFKNSILLDYGKDLKKLSSSYDIEKFFLRSDIDAITSYRFLRCFIDFFMTENKNDKYGVYTFVNSKNKEFADSFKNRIRSFSEMSRYRTGVDINPFAIIGKNFKIKIIKDKPIVIGERCKIGDNVEIHGGVVLGVNPKNNVQPRDRHPYIGNNVIINSDARILGSILVDDNCLIEKNCIVTQSIPKNYIVKNTEEFQVFKYSNGIDDVKGIIYGITTDNHNIIILGDNLDKYNYSIVNKVTFNVTPIDDIVSKNSKEVKIDKIKLINNFRDPWYLELSYEIKSKKRIKYLLRDYDSIKDIMN